MTIASRLGDRIWDSDGQLDRRWWHSIGGTVYLGVGFWSTRPVGSPAFRSARPTVDA
jgi:NO-binding membrane sensor protein with MHYT domain